MRYKSTVGGWRGGQSVAWKLCRCILHTYLQYSVLNWTKSASAQSPTMLFIIFRVTSLPRAHFHFSFPPLSAFSYSRPFSLSLAPPIVLLEPQLASFDSILFYLLCSCRLQAAPLRCKTTYVATRRTHYEALIACMHAWRDGFFLYITEWASYISKLVGCEPETNPPLVLFCPKTLQVLTHTFFLSLKTTHVQCYPRHHTVHIY